MTRVAGEAGYDVAGLAVPMSCEMLNPADLIIAMTEYHRDEITRIIDYDRWDRITLFDKFAFGSDTDVPDPHDQSEDVYRKCFNHILAGCALIAEKLLYLQRRKLHE